MSAESRIPDFQKPIDHAVLCETVRLYTARYPFLRVVGVGRSILGREIPALVLGGGRRQLLYVGAHHGMEWLTAAWLLRFAGEFCEYYKSGRTVYRVPLPTFWERYTLHIIPMLNPDGVEYQIHGVKRENPLYARVIGMNGGKSDFSHWQANARGVDLNHNYDAGFAEYKSVEAELGIPDGAPTRYSGQEPESEPEVRALCSYIRFLDGVRLVAAFHTQGEVIYYRSGGKSLPGGYEAALKVAKLTGYRLADASGPAAYGGLTDWCLTQCGIPALTLECGRGENPLPTDCYFLVYTQLREALFRMGGFY